MGNDIREWLAGAGVAALFGFVAWTSWHEHADAVAWREKFKAEHHCKLIYTGSKGSRYACDQGVTFETSERKP